MRQQSLVHERRVAAHRRLRGEPLVGRDVLHQAEQLGSDGRLRQRLAPPRSTRAGTSTTSPAAMPWTVPSVADVDHVHRRRRRSRASRRGPIAASL
jgi:hypothetical protein